MYAWGGCVLSPAPEPLQSGGGRALLGMAWGGQGLGPTPLLVPRLQEGPQWLHVRDFDWLLRESQREVLRLQRQIALRNQREPPPPPWPPGRAAPARAGAPAPGAPGEVSAGAWAGVWVCGDGGGSGSGDLPLYRAQGPDDAVVACALQGLGGLSPAGSRVLCPASRGSYLRRARPRGLGVCPPQA